MEKSKSDEIRPRHNRDTYRRPAAFKKQDTPSVSPLATGDPAQTSESKTVVPAGDATDSAAESLNRIAAVLGKTSAVAALEQSVGRTSDSDGTPSRFRMGKKLASVSADDATDVANAGTGDERLVIAVDL